LVTTVKKQDLLDAIRIRAAAVPFITTKNKTPLVRAGFCVAGQVSNRAVFTRPTKL